MAHGRRPHVVRNACSRKAMSYTTWEAATAAKTQTKDSERVYRCTRCGYYHITRSTVDEYAQRVAEYTPEPRASEDTIRAMNAMARRREKDEGHQEPAARSGDAGQAPRERSGVARLTPSPLEVARRAATRRGAQES